MERPHLVGPRDAQPWANGNEFFGITAAGANDVWAVGQQQGTAFPGKALVEHWDGHTWQVVAGPAQGGYTYTPYAAAVSASGLIAAGSLGNDKRPQSSNSSGQCTGPVATWRGAGALLLRAFSFGVT